jgi:hypothetical protein
MDNAYSESPLSEIAYNDTESDIFSTLFSEIHCSHTQGCIDFKGNQTREFRL